MELQEKMFAFVEQWVESGINKADFLSDKDFTEAKFSYWCAKWRASKQEPTEVAFKEVSMMETKLEKVLEILAPSGIKITVFA